MARRATSLGPKPSLFVSVVLFLLFFEGFKGQVRWSEGPPHLALNPPYVCSFVCFFVFLFPFLSLLSIEKKLFSTHPPPRKGDFLFIFECLPLFLLCLFWPPPLSVCLSLSLSIYLSLSLSLSFSLSLSLVMFSLSSSLSFFFVFVWFLVFVSFIFFCLLCFCFMKGTTSKY